jgi:hypothetical protein
MEKARRRKNVRIILAILAIIPIILLVQHLIFDGDVYSEDSIREMLFLILGVPILVFNFWAWYYPEMIEYFLWGNQGDQ